MSDERKDLPPASSSAFLERAREALSTYLGNRGDKLDMGITLRHLVDSGITTVNPGFLSGGGRRNPIGGAGPAIADAYEPDLTPPPTPTGFTATAAISNVLVESGAQLYTMGHGHSKSILYGKEWVSGPLPIFTDAQVLTEFQGTVASYATNPATTWHLWLKWVTVDGVPSVTPAGGANGVVVTTGQDVTALVNAMTGPGNPFTILTVDTVIDGVTYPAGTYTTLALIMDAQISNAKIKNLAVDNAKIASMSVAKLTAGSLAVGQYIQSTSYVAGTSGWRINADGTAELANATVRGSIYATAGYLQGVEVRNSAGTVLLNAGDTANDIRNSAIVVGGRNTFINTQRAMSPSGGLSYTAAHADCPYGFYAVGDSDSVNHLRMSNVIKSNGEWTVSWDMRGSQSTPVGVTLDICDAGNTGFVTTGDNTWKRFSLTVNVTNYGDGTVYNFVDFENFQWAYFFIRNIKVEKGNKATDWTPAPEDVDAGIASAATTSTWVGVSGAGKPADNATANQSDATTNAAIAAAEAAAIASANAGLATKLTNAATNVMASGFFLQTNGYAGGNGVALYDGGLIAKQGGVNKFVIGSDGSATFSGVLSAATGSFAGSLSAATGSFAGSLSAATGTLGALTIASGGHVKAGQSAYHTGIGFFLGYNGATPMFSIGNPAGTHMRWDGTDLYINTPTFEPFSASIPSGNLTVSVTFGDQAYGSRSVSPSGGKPGYAYLWVLVSGSTGTDRPYISAGQGTSTVTVRGSGDAVTVVATVACIVTESNGRTTVASFVLTATHGSSGG